MPKVFIYESDRHVYTWPESGFDNDVIREQARNHAEGKLGNGEKQTTTLHHHKRDQACIGYHHESFGQVVVDDLTQAQEQIGKQVLAEMRNSAPIEGDK